MLPYLGLILFFLYLVLDCFKKVLLRRPIIDSIVVYYIIIISNTLNKVANYIELRVVKGWSI